MEEIEKLASWIQESKHLVFCGGAGTSTDSGIKDFRGKNGLYQENFHGYSPEEILSIDFFHRHRDLFLKYVEEKLSIANIKPHAGHYALVELEKMGKLKTIITQNIDDLHQAAGSKKVLELHGTLKDWYCLSCGKHNTHPFQCQCGGTVRPNVTLYGEMLNEKVTEEAIREIQKADVLIVAGSSLTVYPAAYYLQYYKGNKLVIINQSPTQYDKQAGLLISKNFAETMTEVLEYIKKK